MEEFQSVSIYVMRSNGEAGRKVKPWELMHLKYLSKHLTTIQWTSDSCDINCQNLLMEKEISSMVIKQYCNSPTMLLYMLASKGDIVIPSILLSPLPDVIWVSHSLVLNKLHLSNNSLIYFCWLRYRMFILKTISILKK